MLKDEEQAHFGYRAAAFAPGSNYAVRLAGRSFYAIVNDSVFVHGGILPEHVKYGLERFNEELFEFFTKGEALELKMASTNGPFWTRVYSSPPNVEPSSAVCEQLSQTLTMLNAKRMVVGHTIQDKINSGCDEKIWRVDVGMSRAYGGNAVEVLEINGSQTRVYRSASAKTSELE